MSAQTLGMLVGGILPAVLFGFANIFMKMSTERGISIAMYLFWSAMGVLVVSGVFMLIQPDKTVNIRSASFSFAAAFAWAIAVGCIVLSLHTFHAPLGKIVPLFNLNTLFSVLVALWLFAEWKQVHVPQLLLGTVLVTVGGILVSKA